MELKMPVNLNSELLVLSGMLEKSFLLDEYCRALSDDDFYSFDHKAYFSAMKGLWHTQSNIDPTSLINLLKERNKFEETGGIGTYFKIKEAGGWSCHAKEYIAELKKLSDRRRIILSSQNLIKKASECEDPAEVITEAMKDFFLIGSSVLTPPKKAIEVSENYKDTGQSLYETAKKNAELNRSGGNPFDGISTGYHGLDELFGGFGNGKFSVIGARPSQGKTTLLLNFLSNLCERGVRVGFLTLEMSDDDLFSYLVAMKSGVSKYNIDRGRCTDGELEKVCDAEEEVRKFEVVFLDQAGIDIHSVESEVEKMIIKDKIQIVFVDYLTLVKGDRKADTKRLEVDSISKSLKNMASRHRIPVVCLAQLNRQAATQKPTLSQLAECGSIEQDADVVMLIYRSKMDESEKFNAVKPDNTEILVRKNRIYGKLGDVMFEYKNGYLIEMDSISATLAKTQMNSKESNDRRGYLASNFSGE